MAKKKEIDYRETFMFPDIVGQSFPVYCLSESGRLCNFKNIVYPSPSSCKRFTRNKQLRKRSMQAKIFDALINVGYWNPLTVFREFPVVIQNSHRLQNQKRMYYLMDYYFPELKLAVELDSEYHDDQGTNDTDEIRDNYLYKTHGITVFRMRNFEKPQTQKTKFHDLTKLIRSIEPIKDYAPLIFNTDLLLYLNSKSGN